MLNRCKSGYLATGNIYSSVTIRNRYGQSHYPSNVSNLSIWWQLKACFKRSIVKTCILWCICSPCFKLPFRKKKKKVFHLIFILRKSAFTLFIVRKCCSALVLSVRCVLCLHSMTYLFFSRTCFFNPLLWI